jgi:hypothetical protein
MASTERRWISSSVIVLRCEPVGNNAYMLGSTPCFFPASL